VIANRVSLTLEQMYSQLFGLSVVGWRVIAMLGAHAPLSAKALAELTGMSQVNITRAVEQLVELKLVSRRMDTLDRRRVALRLSKEGQAVYDKVVPVLEACESALLAGMSDVDVKALRRIMKSLVERAALVLGEECEWQVVLETYAGTSRPNDANGQSETRAAPPHDGA
jgi:DNA-binding MarR family transcriptional regulator